MFKNFKKNKYQHDHFPEVSGQYYLDVLEQIHKKVKPHLYLEIGSRTGASLKKATGAFIAIDPNFNIAENTLNEGKSFYFWQGTSDSFFASGYLEKLDLYPKLSFIDGMHIFEFALKDFINLESRMNLDSMILVHDVLPFSYEMTTRDTDYVSTGRPWTGDVWKLLSCLRKYRCDLNISVLNARPTGLAVITGLDKNNTYLRDNYDKLVSEFSRIDLAQYGLSKYFSEVKVVSPEQWLNELK